MVVLRLAQSNHGDTEFMEMHGEFDDGSPSTSFRMKPRRDGVHGDARRVSMMVVLRQAPFRMTTTEGYGDKFMGDATESFGDGGPFD